MVEDDGMTERRGARFFISLAWGLVSLVVLCTLIVLGMIGGAFVGFDLIPHFGGHQTAGTLAVGAAAGATLGLVVGHRGRGWLQALRLRRLRREGVTVTATVRSCHRRYIASSRGPGTSVYDLTVAWHDPSSGPEQRTRQYRFWGHGDADFEACVHYLAEVKVSYPAGRPHRFIVEIPYAPTMADQFV
jgi:hypothetical protein